MMGKNLKPCPDPPLAMDIGVPKSKDEPFYSSFYADIIFISTSLSSALSMRTFIYCRKFLKKQKESDEKVNHLHSVKESSRSAEVSTELSLQNLPDQSMSYSESKLSNPVANGKDNRNTSRKISWKSLFIDNFPSIWITTLLL
jgi:hypothetical protein